MSSSAGATGDKEKLNKLFKTARHQGEVYFSLLKEPNQRDFQGVENARLKALLCFQEAQQFAETHKFTVKKLTSGEESARMNSQLARVCQNAQTASRFSQKDVEL
jgi:uncharacterized protein YggL (DUF469 family)